MSNDINVKNRKASFEYEFLDKYIAGIQLLGTEIKSIRTGNVNLNDAYCFFEGDELFIKGMHISEYSFGGYMNHVPKRERKLLLNRQELNKIRKKLVERGLTVIANRLFVTKSGLAKLEIHVARGKHLYDKREDIKKKDLKRGMDRLERF